MCLLAASPHCNDPAVTCALRKFTQALDAFVAELVGPFGLEPQGIWPGTARGSIEIGLPPEESNTAAVQLRNAASPGCRLYPGLLDAEGKVHPAAIAALDAHFKNLSKGTTALVVDADDVPLAALPGQLPQELEIPQLQTTPDILKDDLVSNAEVQMLANKLAAPIKPQAVTGQSNEGQGVLPIVRATAEPVVQIPPCSTNTSARILSEVDALEARSWLQNLASQVASANLHQMLDISPTTSSNIISTAEAMISLAWPTNDVNMALRIPENQGLGEKVQVAASTNGYHPKDTAVALFYRTLHALLSTEIQAARNNGDDDSAAARVAERLASSPVFIGGILTIAIECIAASCRGTTNIDFPMVLQKLRISALDLCKLVAPFALAVPDLPRGLKRHLMHVEERIVESLAWEENKALADALGAATGTDTANYPTITHDMTNEITNDVINEEFSSMANPLPQSLGASPGPNGDPAVHALLSALLRKALKLATLRCSTLLNTVLAANNSTSAICRLAGDSTLSANLDTTLLQTLTAIHVALQDHTWLLYNRHLDHIVLCTLYGIAKANSLEVVTFKGLIEAYSNLPHSQLYTMRQVTMTHPMTHQQHNGNTRQAHDISDVIVFYNQIFLPHMEQTLQSIVSGNTPLIELPNLPLEIKAAALPSNNTRTTAATTVDRSRPITTQPPPPPLGLTIHYPPFQHNMATPVPSPLPHRCPVRTPPRPLDGRLSASPLSQVGRPLLNAVRLSAGHWRMSPAGTSRLGNYSSQVTIAGTSDPIATSIHDALRIPPVVSTGLSEGRGAGVGAVPTTHTAPTTTIDGAKGSKRRGTPLRDPSAQVRRKKEWTPPAAKHPNMKSRYSYSSPVDALLAAAADAEKELKGSDVSNGAEGS